MMLAVLLSAFDSENIDKFEKEEKDERITKVNPTHLIELSQL